MKLQCSQGSAAASLWQPASGRRKCWRNHEKETRMYHIWLWRNTTEAFRWPQAHACGKRLWPTQDWQSWLNYQSHSAILLWVMAWFESRKQFMIHIIPFGHMVSPVMICDVAQNRDRNSDLDFEYVIVMQFALSLVVLEMLSKIWNLFA